LSTNVTVSDILVELRRRRLIPDLRRVRHSIYFPTHRRGPLEPRESLLDIGVKDLSTLHIRALYLGGSSKNACKQSI
jgi:hypothetical protein